MELDGKVAIVTGGAVRLGRAIVLALARKGCNIVLHYGRSEDDAQTAAEDVEALGARVLLHQANLTDAAEARELVRAGREHFGCLDVLVNNAAIFLDSDFASTDLEDWSVQFRVNLRAPFLLSQEFAAGVPADGDASIINVLDARISRPEPDHFAYRLSKGALATMTEILAIDLAPRIRVNAVAPGAILPGPGKSDADLNRLARDHVPLARAGNPNGVVASVIHLLEQDFLTGVTIPVDGGQFL